MKTNVKITGLSELAVILRHAGERVPDKARKTMHRGADKIVEEARLNAPVDEHNLENSIRKERNYSYRGLLISIEVGGYVNGVNVDEYAMRVHEDYIEDKPGPGTKEKRRANPGRHVGGKFLERALLEQEKKLHASMVEAVMSEWHE